MAHGEEGRRFQLIAGHPVLDLVNTLDWRFRSSGAEERLSTYDDLLAYASQSGLLNQRQIRGIVRGSDPAGAERALSACKELREAVAEVVYATLEQRKPPPLAMKLLEEFIKSARSYQHLVSAPPRLQWEFSYSESSPELPVWALSVKAARLLLSEDAERLRQCENPECRWLFLDTSRNRTRRWCDMKLCGNRMKARRFKASRRKKTGRGEEHSGRPAPID